MPAEMRAARSKFLLRLLQQGGMYWGNGIVDYDFAAPDVRVTAEAENVTWIVGKFDSYRVAGATPDDEYLYTEMKFKIDTLIHGSKTSAVAAGSSVDVVSLGGSLRTEDGVVHGAHFRPDKYGLSPGRTYLMALYPRPGGIYFAGRSWDVTSGFVVESSVVDEQRVKDGRAELVGKTMAEAISYIRKKLSPE